MGQASNDSGLSPDFASSFPSAVAALEGSVRDLLSNGWEEPYRKRAHDFTSAFAQAAREAGWKEIAGILGAMTSLLALSPEEVEPVRNELRDKLIELLDLLQDQSSAETA